MHIIVKVFLFFRGNFGGSQPVSMDRKNLELLQQKPYRVTWKADGTRLEIVCLFV